MRKNEQGYALLLVLFLVVFIMAISAVFMRGALSNAKQEKTVDQNHLSVVAAEMGVEYYTALFTNEFLDIRTKAWDDAVDIIKSREKEAIKKGDKTIESLRPAIIKETSKIIKGKLEDLKKGLITKEAEYYPTGTYFENPENPVNLNNHLSAEELDKNKFKIATEGPNDNIHIRAGIVGKYPSGNISKLSLHLVFLMPDPNMTNPDGSVTDPEDSYWVPNLPVKFIDQPEEKCTSGINTKPCRGSDSTHITKDNKVVYFNTNISTGGNIGENFKGLKVYTTKSLNFKIMNNTENLSIFAKGDVKFENAGFINSEIYANGNITFDQFKKDNSGIQLFAGKKLTINDHFEVNNAVIFVNGDLKFDKKLELYNKSKMCVAGNIEEGFQSINVANSKLYILQDNNHLKNGAGDYPPGVEKVNNIKDLQEKCKVGDNNYDDDNNIGDLDSDNIKWKEPIIDVNY